MLGRWEKGEQEPLCPRPHSLLGSQYSVRTAPTLPEQNPDRISHPFADQKDVFLPSGSSSSPTEPKSP